MADRDERIRQRAYEIWDREGRPHGRDEEHWRRAEAELAAGRRDGVPRTGRVGLQKAAAAVGGAAIGGSDDEGSDAEDGMTHAPRSGRVGQQKASGMSSIGGKSKTSTG